MICVTLKPVWYTNIVNTLTYCLLSFIPRCNVSTTELRRAAIHLLLSMLCLPLHFQDLDIKGYTADTFVWKFCQTVSVTPQNLFNKIWNCVHLCVDTIKLKPGTLCCVLGHDTLLSQCLSPPRCINGYWRF